MTLGPLLPIVPESIASKRPLIIAGPCSAESEKQVIDTASAFSSIGVRVFRAGLWKPRTLPGSFEGVGGDGLAWLARVKRETGMLVATEVATAEHVRMSVDASVDILWIGARTSANPFAVQEIADTLAALKFDIPVLVKNPVNPDLDLWIGALCRLYNAGIHRLAAVHRGFAAYGDHTFRNPPLWNIPIELRRRFPEIPLIHDPSHVGGSRSLVSSLSRQAIEMGFDGLMIETHIKPDSALSDSPQQITPTQLASLLASLPVRNGDSPSDTLSELRSQIDEVDAEIIDALARRMAVSRKIGEYKRDNSMPVFQLGRHDDIMKTRLESAVKLGLDPDFIRNLMRSIHEESIRQQLS